MAETTGAELDAIVAAAVAAAPAWGAGTTLAQRAAALEAVADALDERAGSWPRSPTPRPRWVVNG